MSYIFAVHMHLIFLQNTENIAKQHYNSVLDILSSQTKQCNGLCTMTQYKVAGHHIHWPLKLAPRYLWRLNKWANMKTSLIFYHISELLLNEMKRD